MNGAGEGSNVRVVIRCAGGSVNAGRRGTQTNVKRNGSKLGTGRCWQNARNAGVELGNVVAGTKLIKRTKTQAGNNSKEQQ